MATVLIAGAGPTGLMLACELRTAGVDVVLLDRLGERGGESRAAGLHPRSIEVLDQRGILDRFLAEGRPIQAGHFSGIRLDFSGLPTRYPHTLLLMQYRVERLLEQRAAEFGVRVRWSSEVIGLAQHDDGVEVTVRGPAGTETLTADYLVGCDGGHSSVRKLAGIEFPGTDATLTSILADVEIPSPPAEMIFQQRRKNGSFSIFGFEPGWYRVITNEYDRVIDRHAPVDIEDLRHSLIRIAGTDFGIHSPRWVSRFHDAARQADRYRVGRVLLAGDAAHIHFPAGGQGQNLGIQDAVNLGWKLAAVATGSAPHTLLDTYEAERHPVAARVLRNTRAQTALGRPGAHTTDLRETFETLVGFGNVNTYLGGMISALDIHYPLGDAHPLLGRRMPDLDLKTADGEIRTFTLLHAARPVLLDLGHSGDLAAPASGWSDRVDLVTARCEQTRTPLPDIGAIELPAAVLIRPDGHVAWAATSLDIDTATLPAALAAWFGPAAN
ncbi:FAD-dependent monooxygenase [Nocardia pseudobrasiliensis]|uniref:3-(3-hydroxy-phenyl)propionate hydroxylase n=1 Tax=Nocardia pseudobrasiliensis TaxID=45979 RepID=A0A370I3P6_9NOCA|nr:FAD-dependent monooxygenase [Nocardia pseudobrasiliensis]RDI65200.1 3-(3-hydroxy-phenyl)propionate hydroxylase [Nocardia pseudobrasiliensis]